MGQKYVSCKFIRQQTIVKIKRNLSNFLSKHSVPVSIILMKIYLRQMWKLFEKGLLYTKVIIKKKNNNNS